MTAFADYIVPVALRLLGIVSYRPNLSMPSTPTRWSRATAGRRLKSGALHLCYRPALREVNKMRPQDQQIIIPQIDARLWTHYHTTWWPHHLTKTIMY